jgi:hypothetical protein
MHAGHIGIEGDGLQLTADTSDILLGLLAHNGA